MTLTPPPVPHPECSEQPPQTVSAETATQLLTEVPEVPDHAARPAYHRVLAPDLARGFMLLFIALANVVSYLYGNPEGSMLDNVVHALRVMIVDARSYPMFAFLFGYGMVQFYNSRRDRGLTDKAVRVMLRRRHLAMIAIGLVHFMLLFEGDIVAAYGLTGLLILPLFFRRKDKTQFVWAIVLYSLLLAFALVGAVWILLNGMPESVTTQQTAFGFTRSVTNPDYFAAVTAKLPLLIAIPAQVVLSPFVTMMLLGWLAAKRRILENAAAHRRLLVTVAAIGIPIAWLIALPDALQILGITAFDQIATALTTLKVALGVFGALGYISLFALLASHWQANPPRLVHTIAAVGQRSLSSYLLQSLLFAPLLCAWGFGLGAHLGTAASAGLAILVWLASVAMCWLLDRQQRRGPAEVLLRRLTYGAHG